ncbi:hypothetical protein CEXT_362631 [Caerostris extrusa]|uniref:Uncharacterized protein n=1 Tax=Caerostris extrusa TaxID=172846 RepID=A0AAV4XB05_CAEEX|nr:hypothetical protein CEXT_362631 [Caerostris extrusa]
MDLKPTTRFHCDFNVASHYNGFAFGDSLRGSRMMASCKSVVDRLERRIPPGFKERTVPGAGIYGDYFIAFLQRRGLLRFLQNGTS